MRKWLFRDIPIASLVFVRLLFGALAIGEVTGVFSYYHLTKGYFQQPACHFYYPGFGWITPLAEPWMSALFILTLLAAIGVLLGYRYRLSAWVFALGFTYIFFSESSLYLNHGYLFCILSFYMAIVPAHHAFSLDVLHKRCRRFSHIPFIYIGLILFMMTAVYFFGGIAKLNPYWLDAVPMKQWLSNKAPDHLAHWFWLEHLGLGDFIHWANAQVGRLLEADWLAYFLCWGGLAFDLSIAFLMMFRPTRSLAFAAVLFFHFTNHLIFNIGIFPFLSIGLTALFFPLDWPLKTLDWLGRRFRFVRVWRWSWYRRLRTRGLAHSASRLRFSKSRQDWILLLCLLFALYHFYMPFRHWAIPGEVTWTEEGHRYAWRMMLRSKRGTSFFRVVNPETGARESVKPRDHLNDRQLRKMPGHPDMVWQFAQYLEKYYQQNKGWEEVEVYARVYTSMNYQPTAPMVDPSVDLTSVSWKFWGPQEWILPRDEKRMPLGGK